MPWLRRGPRFWTHYPGSTPLVGQAFTVELRNLSSSLADAVFLLIGVDAARSPIALDWIRHGCALYIQPLDATPLLRSLELRAGVSSSRKILRLPEVSVRAPRTCL